MLLVARQLQAQIVFFGKLPVAGRRIAAHSKNLCAQASQRGQSRCEVHSLASTTACIVFGIEVKNQPFSLEIIQADLLPVPARQTELGGSISNLDHNPGTSLLDLSPFRLAIFENKRLWELLKKY